MRKLVIAVKSPVPLWNPPEWFAPDLQTRFPQFRVVKLDSYRDLEREVGDAEVLVSWSLKPSQLLAAKQLRWIHSTAAGISQLLFPEMLASPVILTNASAVMAEPVAEHTLAMILALAKRIPSAVRYQQQAVWGQAHIYAEQPPPLELSGATLGLVGLGAIARELVTRIRPMSMRVIALKRDPTRGREWADEVYGPERLHDVLARSDFVVLAAPDAPSTKGLIGAAALASMKKTAYLINIARGSLLDEPALVEALQQGRIAGAGLDVTSIEPLPPESPLWSAPNLLITHHLAACTERLWRRQFDVLADNLERYLAGQPLRNVVNKQAGY
jgi:phosphoglycerate dehydrogenase-like enzyme